MKRDNVVKVHKGTAIHKPFGPRRVVWRQVDEVRNLRTNSGIDFSSDSAFNTTRPAAARWIALSQNTTAPAATDTAVAGEITTGGLARAQANYAHTNGALSATISWTWTATTGNTFAAVQKAGILTASTGGILVFENVFSPQALNGTNGDQLSLTWTVSL